MNKSKAKRQIYNQDAIKVLAETHAVGKTFVRAAIRGDRDSEKAETIKKEYADLVRPTQKKIEQFKNQES